MTRNYRLTKEQSDEFCKTVKEVLKRIKVSQTRLGTIAGYSRQSICMILGQRAETITRSQYMSILCAIVFLTINSGADAKVKKDIIDNELTKISAFIVSF